MYDGPLIDIDVHHQPRSDAELLPYVPQRSRELATDMVAAGVLLDRKTVSGVMPTGANRLDAVAPDGSAPGSSYEMLRDQLLEPWNVLRCLLTYNVGEYGSHVNPYVAADLCTAANDWCIDQWLGRDDRLHSLIVVSGHLAEDAAREVRRLADHPQMSGVLLGALDRPLGDPSFHPIYEAAAEAGLPVVTHLPLAIPPSAKSVAGIVASVCEDSVQTGLPAGQLVSSFIVHGVFEKFPDLRFVLSEFGLSWLVPTVWNLDREYDSLRRESPWVRRRPSEYIRDHVRLSTQPLETSMASTGRALAAYLGAVEAIEDILCYSSDYPHYTMDDRAFVSRVLPDEWHSKVFFENACDTFGWSDLAARAPDAVGTA